MRSLRKTDGPRGGSRDTPPSGFGLICLLFLLGVAAASAQPVITEFMAANASTLADEDGSFEDWIEIHNPGTTTVSLAGWYLTDSGADLRKWQFPATNLNGGGFLVVFASNKNRRVPGQPLHTDFKLSPSGEYLALVEPDGATIATEFAPAYPQQFTDVSYGYGMQITKATLIAATAPVRLCIPADGGLGNAWTMPGFTDATWMAGTNGVGYETGLADPLESSYAGQVLNTAPDGYWRLNETNGPTAPNLGTLGAAANATYHGNIGFGTPGPRPPQFSSFEADNRAPAFNGTDAYVGGPSPLLNNLGQFTMTGWVRPTATQGSRTGLFGQNDVIEFGFIDAATIQLWTWYGYINIAYPFPLNEWHHLAAAGDGSSLKLYFDGVLNSTANAPTAGYGSSTYNFNIGGGGVYDPSGNWFKGQIDEVAFWRRALASNEVSQLLVGGSGSQVSFATNINTDLRSIMYGINSSLYLRIPFVVADPASIYQLTLRMKYDDGFVAYLNGQEVARKNALDSPSWNSSATGRHLDSQALQFEDIDVTASRFLLAAGSNVLAIHGLNISATNTDFLLQCELKSGTISATSSQPGFFVHPTPGAPNGFGSGLLGPIISAVGHMPDVPTYGSSLVVTARVANAFYSVSNVVLNYRVMFGPEIPLPMNDSGTGGDAVSGDSIWTANIPAGAATNGQMIRYYVSGTDVKTNSSRWPLFADPAASEQYLGTIVADPTIQSLLPVLHLFVENTAAADTFSGTRGSIFYLGELYDNVVVNLHGGVTTGFPKKSYHFGFCRDHHFLYQAQKARVGDIYVLTNWGDKSKTHNTLVYEFIARAGSLGHFAFPVRLHRNGFFCSTYDLVEFGDEDWLARVGRDPKGALYKMDNDLSSAYGNTKRTRTYEDNSDLQALVNNLDESLSLSNRAVYAYDNLDLPQCVSYFVAMALISSQDHGHKNYYIYRDSVGSGEWAIIPWDVDLSWGRNWIDAYGYLTDTLYQNNVLSFYNSAQQGKPANRLYDLMFGYPDFRRMYLRRLRTIMDTLLKAPGTPTNQLPIEAEVRALMDRMAPTNITPNDAALDYAKWGYWGANVQMRQEAGRILDVHLPGRRDFLFNNPNAMLQGERIPASQPTNTTIVITALDPTPASGNQAEEYIQLANTNSYAVDISGWELSGAVRFVFKLGTVIPAGGSLYVSPEVAAFRARTNPPHGGQGLFVQGNYEGQLSAWGETVVLSDDLGQVVATKSYAGNPSPAQLYLRITEIMYNPAPLAGNTNDPQQFEYVELRNISSNVTLNLSGVRFTNGIYFSFTGSTVTNLLPGQNVLVVRNIAAFAARYGAGFNIAGQYTGHLANGGETLRLEDAVGEKILEFAYDNHWYPVTDGLGFSLVIVDENAPWFTWGQKESWRPSARLNGSPGAIDPQPSVFPPVVVNEVLAHTDLPQAAAVELYNPASSNAPIGGWFLTDDASVPQKYRIPDNIIVPPGGYWLIRGSEFGQGAAGFSLSGTGGHVFLLSADATTNLTGYCHGFSFGPSPKNVSLGRYVNSQGEEDLVLQTTNTLGTNNAPPLVGPIVISEIMYRPTAALWSDTRLGEFVELQNISGTNVPLFDRLHHTNTWRLRNAVDYDFPTNTSLAAYDQLLVVGFDPGNTLQLSNFRETYGVPTNVPVVGPWTGSLSKATQSLELKQPDEPLVTETNVAVPYVLVEKTSYKDGAPWPTNTAATGCTLQRLDLSAYGNDPTNWFGGAPTPGRPNRPDSDSDGMPDWWERANGTNPFDNDANADPDNDGMTNLQEYWAGTSPTNAASALRIASVVLADASSVVLTFPAISNRVYSIECCPSLSTAGWSTLAWITNSSTDRMVQVTNDLSATPARFYRLVVHP